MLVLGFDLVSNTLFAPGADLVNLTPLTGATLKNGVVSNLVRLRFYQQGSVVAAPAGLAALKLGLKLPNEFDADDVAACLLTLVADDPSTNTWNGTLSTANPACDAALNTGTAGSTAAELPSAPLMGAVTLFDADGNLLAESQTFDLCLLNNVNKSTGTLPALYMLNWNKITVLTGGSLADSLDAQPTAGVIAYGTLIALTDVTDPLTGALVNGGGLTTWKGYNDPAAVRAPGVVVPLDFNAATNPFAWIQKS